MSGKDAIFKDNADEDEAMRADFIKDENARALGIMAGDTMRILHINGG